MPSPNNDVFLRTENFNYDEIHFITFFMDGSLVSSIKIIVLIERSQTKMRNTCKPMADSCQCMAKPLQYCKVISLQIK